MLVVAMPSVLNFDGQSFAREDHLVLFLNEPDGDDVLQEGGNIQGFAHVGPLVTEDHLEVVPPS